MMKGTIARKISIYALFLIGLTIPGLSKAQVEYAAPLIGAWEYGENRCESEKYGYAGETDAVIGGANRHYQYTNTCTWSYAPLTAWGTDADPVSGSCGSSNYYPTYKLGILDANTRQYTISYRYGDACENAPTEDGLTTYMRRKVNCPNGYYEENNRCKRFLSELMPNKNNDCCIAGKNGSNPIHSALGDKMQEEKDFDLGGGLRFVRHYSSSPAWGVTSMGSHWRHNFLMEVRLSTSAGPNSITTAWIIRPDGNEYAFHEQSGVWQGDPDVPLTLTPLYSTGTTISGWKIEGNSGVVENYDSDGKLVEIYDRIAGSVFVTNIGGRISSIKDARGRTITFNYDNYARISSIVDPAGATYTYYYDSFENLSSVEYPESNGTSARTYQYEEGYYPSALTGIVDERGVRYASWDYDLSGKAILSVHGSSISNIDRHTFQYNFDGTTSVTDSLGRTRVFSFTQSYGVMRFSAISESCVSCGIAFQARTYDNNGYPDVSTDFTGSTIDSDYNPRGLLTKSIEAANDTTGKKRTTQTDWHTSFRAPAERRTYNSANTLITKSTWTYNTRGQVLTASQIDPSTSLARTTTTTYCEQSDVTAGTCPLLGLVTSINGPRTDITDTTSYTYRMADEASCATTPTTCPYRKGDLWKVTNALSQVTETLKYDGAGRVLSVKDTNGVVTDLEYHPRGWLTARKTRGTNGAVETDDAITQIEYWPTGLVKKVTQPDGAFTSYTYDAAHRLTDIADNAGNTIHYTLDNAGNRTQEDTRDPANVLKRTLSRVFNQLGQLQTQADAQANPTDFTYDANGNPDTVTDALGRVTDNDYDPLGRLSRTLQDVGGINAQTQFAYDAQDNLTQVTDPKGLSTTYTYNGLGDLTQLVSPDTGTTAYTYDSAGNRSTQTDARNQTSTYSYDALNRLTGIAYATSALNVGYAYDANQAACTAATEKFSKGRLTKLTDASGTTQYCYDRFGNLVRKVQTTNGIALTVRYAYTLAGQLKTVTYPDGAVVTYTRDPQGRITQAAVKPAGSTANLVVVKQVAYAPFGPSSSWKYGNNRTLERPLNQNYQPTAIHDAATGGLSVGFQYDPVGNLTQLTPVTSTTPLVKFDYDTLSRLTAFKDGPTNVAIESYAYDATGNRQSFTNAGGTQAYTYPSTSHRLSQVGATARTYDNAGNTTAIGGLAKEFVYDDTGRMSQVKQNAIVQMNYAYNGKGEQVRKYQGTVNTYTVYDEAGHWLGDYDNTGTALQQAIWLDDLPVGLIANGNQLHYIEPDHLGTPRVVIEVARNVPVWSWDLKSEAFGNSVPNQDPDGDAHPLVFGMRFPGQRYDAASGLNQNGNRDYDAGSGRYPQSDLVGLRGGISTYGYAYGNPLTWIDPDGLLAVPIPMGPGMTGAAGAAGAYNPNSSNNLNNVNPELPPTNTGDGWPKIKLPEVPAVTADGILESLFKMSPLNALSQLEQAIGKKLNNVCEGQDEREKNCQALRESILATCSSLTGRKKFACFAAAQESYNQCMQD